MIFELHFHLMMMQNGTQTDNHLFAWGRGLEGNWRDLLSRSEGFVCWRGWLVTAVWIGLKIISGVKVEFEGFIS